MAGTFAQKGGAIRWGRLPQLALPAISLCAVRLVLNVINAPSTSAATAKPTRVTGTPSKIVAATFGAPGAKLFSTEGDTHV